MNKITEEALLKLGFSLVTSMIQDSYHLVLKDEKFDDPWVQGLTIYIYKAISVAVCNDKGQGEYYLFMREGSTKRRIDDQVFSITRNLQYIEDLEQFVRITRL